MKAFRYILHAVKLMAAFALAKTIFRNLYNREIWLITEKRTEARDNGYHLFKYIRENHKEINAYYIITKDSVDLPAVKKYGNIICNNSIRHCIYFFAAKNSIGSQPFGAYPFDFPLIKKMNFLTDKKQHCIHLQHGITKNELPHDKLDYLNAGYSIFACAAERERDFIMQTYGYPEDKALLLGFCRFDNLHGKENRQKRRILVMPTFREWLVASERTKNATSVEKEKFKGSTFYKTYIELLNHPYLADLLGKYDHELVFYLHYSLQSYVELFKQNVHHDKIVIADRFHYDVQDLLIGSSSLITDFSSVCFDFAYMKKPEIFFQFDEEEFRQKHYKPGYFSDKEDGFGPVVKNIDELLAELEKILANDNKMEDKYLKRANEFFTVRDTDNCRRTFEAIVKLR